MNTLKTISMLILSMLGISAGGINVAYADEPFIGEIRQFPYTFCPRDWVEANGQLYPISAYTAAFSILGTTFGGDGRTTFAIPNLQNKVAKGYGSGPGLSPVQMGQTGGVNSVTMDINQMPNHSHVAQTTSRWNVSTQDGISPSPDNAILADDGRDRIYNLSEPDAQLSENAIESVTTVSSAGSAVPFSRQQPYIAMRYCVALNGIFPPRS